MSRPMGVYEERGSVRPLSDLGGPASGLHVAIIMDGNGRWAQARGLPRIEGHRRGVEAVRRAVRAAIEFDTQHRRGVIHKDVVNRMRANADMYLPEVLTAMSTVAENAEASEVKFVTIATLEPGQVLEEGLRGSNGCLLLGKGEELTAPLIARLTSLGLAPRQRVRVRSIGYTPF